MTTRILTIAAAVMLALAAPAAAQDWPQQTIRIIVAFGPGGGSDIVGRILAQAMQDRLGQSVVVENRPGAAGTLGNEMVARADKDGYTLGIMTAGQIIAAAMNKSMRYDTLTAFDPIAQVASAGLIIVTRPDYPSKSVRELIAAAKAKPGKIVFASPGYGATQHLAAELFKQTAGVDMLHVPFRTSPEAISAVLGKQVDILFDTVLAVLGQVQSGQLKAIAVTGAARFPVVPDVPPAVESGVVPGYDVTTWYGFFAPRGTPPAVVTRLNSEINRILVEPDVKAKLLDAGADVMPMPVDQFVIFVKSESEKFLQIIKDANLKPE